MNRRLRWSGLIMAVVSTALAATPARAHDGGGLPGVGLPAAKGVQRLVTADELRQDPRFDVLVFSRTTGFRHTDAIDAGKAAIAGDGRGPELLSDG